VVSIISFAEKFLFALLQVYGIPLAAPGAMAPKQDGGASESQ